MTVRGADGVQPSPTGTLEVEPVFGQIADQPLCGFGAHLRGEQVALVRG
jgi:hypothetical protein